MEVGTYFATEGEEGVTEETDRDDGSAEQLRGVDVRHYTSPWQVVVHHSRVYPARPDKPGLLHRPDDELLDPVGDGVHLPPGVELLLPRPSLLQLAAVGVALSKEILCPQRSLVHCEPPVRPPPGLLHNVVNVPLDDGGLRLVKELLGVDTVKHLPLDPLPVTHGEAGVVVSEVRRSL